MTDCQAEAKEAANLHKAREFFKKVTHSLQDKDNISRNPAAYALQLQLADRHVHWAAPILATHEPYMIPLSVAVTLADTERSTSLPDGLDPIAWLQALPVQTPQTLNLIQQADLSLSLNADFTPETAASGASPLAGLALNRPVVLWALDEGGQPLTYQPWHWQTAPRDNAPVLPELLSLPDESLKPAASLRILTGRQQIRFERLAMPSWAAGMGQDNDGLCADLEFKGITQRFRWINPGMFMMGSSNDEAERFDNELQHQVTLTRGYWLADTTCTIALWEAVMDKNTSTFKENPDNPVENVSWDDVQAFIQRLNQSLPGLSSRLPSEAEWEYACRGGTSTPFSFGENITTEQVNYNGGYPYAGGVKGEYRGKTLPVKSLPTNSWGLYGIHGNVWEWCADWYGDYESGMAVDPAGPRDGSDRVLRGGSWFSHAGYTRSASRGRNIPAVRYDYYGFRLALGRTGKSPEEQEGRYTAAGRFGEGVRLHKFLADRGKYGSRRSIEAKISEGRIWINGRKASIGDRYYPGDTIHIDGRSIDLYEFLEKTEVILYYKAKGEVVSHNDPKNRPTVFDHLPEPQQGKWMAAGRMGIKNEGLLLLTTNGELANQLNQKLHSIPCSYQVRVFGEIDNDAVARLTEGLVAKGGTINRFESIEPLGRQESSNRWYKIQVNDGRSAYLDTILKSQEIVFNRVIRTKFADVELPKDMKAGEYEALEQEQYLSLMALVGL